MSAFTAQPDPKYSTPRGRYEPPRMVRFGTMKQGETNWQGFQQARHEGPADAAERRDYAKHLTRGLPRRMRWAVELHYLEGLTQREAGKAIGVSRSRISQLISGALAILRAKHSAPPHPVAPHRPGTARRPLGGPRGARRETRLVDGVACYRCRACNAWLPRDGFYAQRSACGRKSDCKRCCIAATTAAIRRKEEARGRGGPRHA